MSYVDGYVLPVPAGKLEEYRAVAEQAGQIWMEHGALAYKECVGEDMEDKGFCRTFPQTAGVKEGETVVFAFVIFTSREHRDAVNAKVHADPRLQCGPENAPFDCQRMTYGGFRAIVDL